MKEAAIVMTVFVPKYESELLARDTPLSTILNTFVESESFPLVEFGLSPRHSDNNTAIQELLHFIGARSTIDVGDVHLYANGHVCTAYQVVPHAANLITIKSDPTKALKLITTE